MVKKCFMAKLSKTFFGKRGDANGSGDGGNIKGRKIIEFLEISEDSYYELQETRNKTDGIWLPAKPKSKRVIEGEFRLRYTENSSDKWRLYLPTVKGKRPYLDNARNGYLLYGNDDI